MHRRFCPICGTPLLGEAEAPPHLVFVRVGTLDDPEIARPAQTIWTSAAPTWACIDERIARRGATAARRFRLRLPADRASRPSLALAQTWRPLRVSQWATGPALVASPTPAPSLRRPVGRPWRPRSTAICDRAVSRWRGLAQPKAARGPYFASNRVARKLLRPNEWALPIESSPVHWVLSRF
jgi:Glutathione-dependent formaldehyde-activating enzyme